MANEGGYCWREVTRARVVRQFQRFCRSVDQQSTVFDCRIMCLTLGNIQENHEVFVIA